MKTLLLSLFTFFSLSSLAADFKTMTADELNSRMIKKEDVQIFDANTDAVRKKWGVISGAKLISNSSSYDTAILPVSKETAVVFYCYNEMCTASHNAAKRAMSVGYKNAYVMKDGITGWSDKKFPITR